MHEYHKIDCLYYRDPDTRMLDSSRYRNPCVEYLKDLLWVFTEKVDGTNIRVVWDGYRVSFYGRTDRAVIPDGLMKRLEELFGGEENEQLFEQRFGNKEVIIFGEGYGGKIQANVGYRPNEDFIIFDVEINGNMLMREDVKDIASMFKCSIVPIAITGTIADAVKYVSGFPKSMLNESVQMEGVVGIPAIGLKDKSGNRIITKIKVRELQEVEKQEKMAAKTDCRRIQG